MNPALYEHCKFCFRARDAYSDPSVHQTRGQRSQGTSASSSAARRSKATADFRKPAGRIDINSIDIGHDVTPEETSISLSKISDHVHGPSERESALEKPIDEARNRKEPDKDVVAADETSILEDTYEQWIADDILRDTSGDERVSDDVEPKSVHETSSDPESDLDSLLEPLIEPRTGDRRSDAPDTGDQTRAKLDRGCLLPPIIYMLFIRVCGIVTRIFEPNPLPGRTRIRWRCVSFSRYVLLLRKRLFT